MSTQPLWAGWRDEPVELAPPAAPTPRPQPNPAARAARRRRPAPARPRAVNALALLAGLGLGITIALAIGAESSGTLAADGGIATALGRLAGLVAAYAMVVVVVLSARLPVLERAIGQDRLIAWHRRLGPYPLYLLVAHAALVTVGYAQAAHDGVLHQFGQLVWTYPGILASVAGSALLIAAGVTSYRKARRRMAYETWWSVHLYTYLALFLAFSHQVDTGAAFVGHPVATAWWTALWIGTLALVLTCRVGLPVWRSLRHRLRVEEVRRESPDTVSIILSGHGLARLPVAGGQFLNWRFLRRGMWWQAHPFSLSAVPSGNRLRITVKDLGDHSHALTRLRRGTWVAIEGPYGAFTADAAQRGRVLLVGAGVGITPVRAMLQDLPAGTDVAVLSRASRPEDLVLREEIHRDVAARGGRVHELVGPRERVPLDAPALVDLVPDLARRDVFICGPDGFTTRFAAAARAAGVPRAQIHHETFTL
ncbi:MAG: ferric reductase-like transmembrane domain-containing protein [Solirubrobacteraceae bacterium]|nr:ferric reductase-like transmembrane domain-containing protein [Solirubrobacteraceae bacterium]